MRVYLMEAAVAYFRFLTTADYHKGVPARPNGRYDFSFSPAATHRMRSLSRPWASSGHFSGNSGTNSENACLVRTMTMANAKV